MKYFFFLLLFSSFVYAIDGMKNIQLHTIDSTDVLEKISQRINTKELQNLKKYNSYKMHIQNVENLREYIKEVLLLQNELQETQTILNHALYKYNNDENIYTQKMKAIYKKNALKKRETYYLLSYPTNIDYMPNLQNYLIDAYSLEKFHQKTEIVENQDGLVSYSNTIQTTKDLGEIRQETLQDFTYRDKNLNIRFLKIVQSPFSNTKQDSDSETFETSVEKFDLPQGVTVFPVNNLQDVKKNFLYSLDTTPNDTLTIVNTLKENVNFKKANKNLKQMNKKIAKVLKKIAKTHQNYNKHLNTDLQSVNQLLTRVAEQKQKLQLIIDKAEQIAKLYSIDLDLYELDKLIILQPRLYSENVEFGEEKEFILRKSKSYLSKINITSLVQSESLHNGYDLQTKNTNKQKFIEYKSSHIFVFPKGKELSMLLFDVIELKDKISKADYVTKYFKYTNITFVPIKYRFQTFFIANSELNLGIVKEFLQTHKQNKYFDKYCIEDSVLPQQAKNFSKVNEIYYDYPAVCFKVEKINDLLQWLSKKTAKKIILPTPEQWSYVASNLNTSTYCWGNESIEELNDDESTPANIYYENNDDTCIQPIKQYPHSMVGMYDMCGNIHELVVKNHRYGTKGMSYISFMEESNAPMADYDEELNSAIGIRILYKKDNK